MLGMLDVCISTKLVYLPIWTFKKSEIQKKRKIGICLLSRMTLTWHKQLKNLDFLAFGPF